MDNSVLTFLIKLQADKGNVVNVAQQTSQQLDTISRKATTAGARIREAFSFSNFKGSLMAIPGMQFLANPYVLAAAGVGAIAKIGAQTEQTTVAFEVLVGSEKKAAALLRQINDYAAATPFSTMNLEKASQMMLNFGVDSKDVMTYLKELGDISMGSVEKLNSLALVFGQVSAAGKLQGQDLNQFIQAGFNPMKELVKMTGKSYNDLKDMMEKGEITSNAVSAALKHATEQGGLFHGMMKKTSETVLGKWSTALGNLIQNARSMFDYIKPSALALIDAFQNIAGHVMSIVGLMFKLISSSQIIRTVFSLIIKITTSYFAWLDNTLPKVIKFFHDWGTEISYVTGFIAAATIAYNLHNIALLALRGITLVVAEATRIWTAVQAALNFVLVANPIGLVITGIALLVTAVIYCWNKFAGFRAFILTVWDVLKMFGTIIKTYVIDKIGTFLNSLESFGTVLSTQFSRLRNFILEIWTMMKGLGSIIKEYVIDRIQKLLGGMGKIGSTLANLFNGNFGAALKSATSAISALYDKNYKQQTAATKTSEKKATATKTNSITTPALKGSKEDYSNLFGKGDGKKKKGKKTAEELATGGTRNTSIHINIGKFFDNINVTMADRTDTAELERIVVQSLNRALAIATSTDR